MSSKDLLEMQDLCEESVRYQKASLNSLASCFNDKAWIDFLNEKDSIIRNMQDTQEVLIKDCLEEMDKDKKEEQSDGDNQSES